MFNVLFSYDLLYLFMSKNIVLTFSKCKFKTDAQ